MKDVLKMTRKQMKFHKKIKNKFDKNKKIQTDIFRISVMFDSQLITVVLNNDLSTKTSNISKYRQVKQTINSN